MKKQELEAFAREVAKGLKTEEDLNEFSQLLTKVTVEAALNAELEDHLGYARHEPSENANSRNGYGSKTLRVIQDTHKFPPRYLRKCRRILRYSGKIDRKVRNISVNYY